MPGYPRFMPGRTQHPTALPFLPERLTLAAARAAVQRCEGCAPCTPGRRRPPSANAFQAAAQSLLGRGFRVTQSRGVPLDSDLAEVVVATIHPSAVLRADDREAAFAGLVDDLRVVATG